ncbi:2-oxo acid dehydrogenase subunit E2 [Candidatus Comchoanobacter bicostacola]|uniref:Dihydrolipoamide acetyltransferase component of pyruvate dehydrogenase complex n=1 Tax=Candidatus Comchoanobacter bicostacola TaxID=2919598 RepID=A0ABY5DLB8_9GAMM|nr:2-oxo acid dehydrogenase subunit E2 [Candidatus Comchoanobacter bicostacola]UTC24758.1 2-oxo acid dehydrogenase subunit E2 [Candidatus Comchoanobacter bicostacola]
MEEKTLVIPDLGGHASSRVIEVIVSPGDTVSEDQGLITLESDKASMEIPAEDHGVVHKVLVSVGDEVAVGDPFIIIQCVQEDNHKPVKEVAVQPKSVPEVIRKKELVVSQQGQIKAGPFVRRIAREMSINLDTVSGSGPSGQITVNDIKHFLQKNNAQISEIKVPLEAIGLVSDESMTRIQVLASNHLQSVWQQVPQVTQHHEVDITELDVLRAKHKAFCKQQGANLTILPIVMKVLGRLIPEHHAFNRIWAGDDKYWLRTTTHISFAVETPQGLCVPVVHNVNEKDIMVLAKEIHQLSDRARQNKLSKADIQGGSMSISSLGAIGGGHFTPIINAPECAILGIAKAQWKPTVVGKKIVPRYMMPVSLSYDHRLIDGAQAARMIVALQLNLESLVKDAGDELLAYI